LKVNKPTKPNRSESGRRFEELACAYLGERGLRLLQKNFRSPYGEIDIIMRESGTLVFVEVRYRHSEAFGGAAASVDSKKRLRLCKTAELYMQLNPTRDAARFDVISIGADEQIVWYRNAFDATG
jgi:putative endonuclease